MTDASQAELSQAELTALIRIESNPSREKLESLGVFSWPVWEKGVSLFSWTYDEREICYLLEGAARVTPAEGGPVEIRAGDLAVFPKGLRCHWRVVSLVRKHYSFD
jgi:uncharacterized protein